MRKWTMALLGQGAVFGAIIVVACSSERKGPDPERVAAAEGALSDSVTFAIDPSVPSEHCRMSSSLQASYGSGNQVRISPSASDTHGMHLGLCTVDSTAHTVDGGAATVYLNSATAYKRLALASGTKAGTVSNQYTDGGTGVAMPKSIPDASKTLGADSINQDIFEYSRYDAGASVAYTAPHGRIEAATDTQVKYIADNDSSWRNALWTVRYDTSATGPTDAGGAVDHNHLHITATDISGASFPRLGALLDDDIPYAVAFHGFSEVSTVPGNTSYSVIVGGRVEELFRRGVAEIIGEYLATVSGLTYNNAWWQLNLLPSEYAGFTGTASDNYVNRLAAGGRGLQLEQIKPLRDHAGAPEKVAEAVKSVYDCLLDAHDSTATLSGSSPRSASLNSTGVSLSTDQCPRWIADVDTPTVANLVLDGGIKTCADGATAHIDIYQRRADDTWRRIGGGKKTYAGTSPCTTNTSAYVSPTSVNVDMNNLGQFRIVVRATSLGGSAADASATVSY